MYQGVVDMTEKQQFVIGLLQRSKEDNIGITTNEIIAEYEENYEDSISYSYVRRIRKWYDKNCADMDILAIPCDL